MSYIKKIVFLSVFVSFIWSCGQVNKTCSIKKEQLPELRGILLGMSLDELNGRFPNAGIEKGAFGASTMKLYPTYVSIEDRRTKGGDVRDFSGFRTQSVTRPQLTGIEEIDVSLLDNLVVGILVKYDSTLDSTFGKVFFKKIDEDLGLEGGLLRSVYSDERTRQCFCGRVSIRAKIEIGDRSSNRDYPTLFIHDLESNEIIQQRRVDAQNMFKEYQNKKTEEFKT